MTINECGDYKVLGFKDSGTRATIMIASTGKTFDIRLGDLLKSEIMDKLSTQEIKHIFRRHYSRNSTTTAYELHDRHEASWMVYTALNIMCFCYLYLPALQPQS